MTIEGNRPTSQPAVTTTPTGSVGTPSSDGGGTATKAKEESSAVAHTAKDAGKEVMGEVSNQASNVATTARDQIQTMLSRAQDEIHTQTEARGQQLASGLSSFSRQLGALAQGRPQEAGDLTKYVGDAQRRLESYASSLEERGPRGLMDDVTSFARRRPGMFLLAASAAGFMIGRMVRSGKESESDETRPGEQKVRERPEMPSETPIVTPPPPSPQAQPEEQFVGTASGVVSSTRTP